MQHHSKPQSKKAKTGNEIVAQILLRAVSGKSIRELAQGSLPENLEAYLPPAAAREEVMRFFERQGFRVFGEASGLSVSIHGSVPLFSKAFGEAATKFAAPSPVKTIALSPPTDIAQLIEQIVIMPAPELHDP
jgi:hypothetical protein